MSDILAYGSVKELAEDFVQELGAGSADELEKIINNSWFTLKTLAEASVEALGNFPSAVVDLLLKKQGIPFNERSFFIINL